MIFDQPAKEEDFWSYRESKSNNDQIPAGEEDDNEIGGDPYGFFLLDGKENTIQSKFHQNWVFVHPD